MILDLEALVADIPHGATLAVPPDYSGCAMAAVRGLIRRGVRSLHLIGVPQVGLQGDWLIGAGCVRTIATAALAIGEGGAGPRFRAAVEAGTIELRDATCPAIHAGLQAAEKGLPFMPLRGLIGSDLLVHRPDWKVIDNPLEPGDAIVILPAIQPDVALFHAPLADRSGNVWIGIRRELMLMAHAARRCLVPVEEITEEDLLADEQLAPGTIPALYVEAVARAPSGAWPVGLFGRYPPDRAHIARYLELAGTEAGFARYLEEHLREPEPALP